MTTTVQRIGNIQGFCIPKTILDAVSWKGDEGFVVTANDNRIIIEKAEKRKNIKELFAGYHGEYTPVEIDWGNPVGAEIW